MSASFALSFVVKLSFDLDPVHNWDVVGENRTDKVGSIDFAVGIFVVGVVVSIVVFIVVVDTFVVFVVVGIGVVVGLGAENIKWFDNL